MRRLHAFLALLLVSTTALFAQIDTERVVTIGRNAIYFKDYVLAIQYFNTAIQAEPYKAEPYYYRGLAKFSLDDYRGAEQDCDLCLERNPFIYDAYYLRAISRHTLHKDSLAVADYEMVLRNNPDHKGALHNASLLHIASGDTVKARATLDHLQRFYANYPEGYLIDGGYRLERGDTIAAVALFEKAIEMSPGLPGAYISMAGISYDKRDFKEAERYMDAALAQNSSRPELYFNRALMRYQQNNIRGAMQDYTTAVELDPSNATARYNRALLRAQVGELNGSLEDFTYLLQLEPNNYFAIFNRGLIAQQLGYLEVAEKDMGEIIQRYPSFIPAYTHRSEIRRLLGRERAANEDLQFASRMMYDPTTHQMAVQQHEEQNKLEEHEGINELRDDKDENIRKFKLLVYNSRDKGYNELYQEGESIRGRVQDRDVVVSPEPMYTLSYYDVVDEKLRSSTNLSFSHQLDLPTSSNLIRVVRRVPSLSFDLIEAHREQVETQKSVLTTNDAEQLFAYAMNQLTLKDHESVIEALTKVVELDPQNVAAHFQLATSRFLAMQARLHDLAPEKTPSSTPALRPLPQDPSLSETNILKNRELSAAIADLERVLAVLPKYAPALYNIAYLYAEQGNYTTAIDYYTQAIAVEPQMAASYFNRGLCYYAIGEKTKGDEDLSQAGALGLYGAYSIIRGMK
ncbi:MAG: tetratricopeptide repeat protein [Porphyromonas sp.]|nr:tetratricopeptide repeat protein [Porphyromonas sp.]